MAFPGWSMVGLDSGCGSSTRKNKTENTVPTQYYNPAPPPPGNYGGGAGYGYGYGYNNGPPPGPPGYPPMNQGPSPPMTYNGPPPGYHDTNYNLNPRTAPPPDQPPYHAAPLVSRAAPEGGQVGASHEVLRICKKYGGAQFTIDRVNAASGQTTAMWILHRNLDENVIALLYADHQQQQLLGDNAAVSAKLHKWSTSSIDMTLRGSEPFKLKGNDSGTGHKFVWNGRKMKWVQDEWTLSTSKLYLKDENGQTIGRYLRKPDGRLKAENPTFELMIPVNEMDMDLFIGTGVAVAAYWAKQKKDGMDVVSELFGMM